MAPEQRRSRHRERECSLQSRTWRGAWSVRGGVRKEDGFRGLLAEVEVVHEVAKLGAVLADVRARVGATIRGGIKALPLEENVFDELHVGVVAQGLVIDVPLLCVGADDDSGNPRSVAVLIDNRWGHMIVEAAKVVPREEDRGAVPVWA